MQPQVPLLPLVPPVSFNPLGPTWLLCCNSTTGYIVFQSWAMFLLLSCSSVVLWLWGDRAACAVYFACVSRVCVFLALCTLIVANVNMLSFCVYIITRNMVLSAQHCSSCFSVVILINFCWLFYIWARLHVVMKSCKTVFLAIFEPTAGHILTVQSNQFSAVQKAECAVQVSKLCSPKYVLWIFTQINNKSYSLICCICSGGRCELATCLSCKREGCTVSANSVAGLQRLTQFPGITLFFK